MNTKMDAAMGAKEEEKRESSSETVSAETRSGVRDAEGVAGEEV